MKFGVGFARGLESGQRLTQGVMATYKQAQQEQELAKVAEAKPQESQGFTAEQGQNLEKLAKQGYAISYDEGKGGYVATNEAGDTKSVAMQGVTDFMGSRTAGSLSPQQEDTQRAMAMASVIGKTDPARGMQLRMQANQQAHQATRDAREEKQWAKDDARTATIEGIDKELGAAFEAGLVGEDGQRRQPGADDFLKMTQQRAMRLANAGHVQDAQKAMQDHMAQSHIKIQLEGAERKQALGQAMAALGNGDYGAVADFYNKFVPSGSKVTGIERDKSGGLVMNRTGLDGNPMAPMSVKNEREAMAMLASLENPNALYQYSQDEFRNGLQLRADARADRADSRAAAADGRAAASHSASMQDRNERRSAMVGLAEEEAREAGTTMTDARRRAVRAGIIQPNSATGKTQEKYAYDPVKIQKTFGTTQVDPLTQKETVKRDLAKEQQFSDFIAENPQIRTTDEALMRFQQGQGKERKKQAGEDAQKQASYEAAVKQTRKLMTPENLAATAKKYNMSVEEVRSELAAKGIVQ
ncbi:MAG: hypothetical protein RR800_00355 [Comamonas sp.]